MGGFSAASRNIQQRHSRAPGSAGSSPQQEQQRHAGHISELGRCKSSQAAGNCDLFEIIDRSSRLVTARLPCVCRQQNLSISLRDSVGLQKILAWSMHGDRAGPCTELQQQLARLCKQGVGWKRGHSAGGACKQSSSTLIAAACLTGLLFALCSCVQVCIYCTLLPLQESGVQLPAAVSKFMSAVSSHAAVKAGTEQVGS